MFLNVFFLYYTNIILWLKHIIDDMYVIKILYNTIKIMHFLRLTQTVSSVATIATGQTSNGNISVMDTDRKLCILPLRGLNVY